MIITMVLMTMMAINGDSDYDNRIGGRSGNGDINVDNHDDDAEDADDNGCDGHVVVTADAGARERW